MMIEISVSKTIQAPIESVYNLLIDISSYNNWWKIPVKYDSENNNYFQFSPFPFVHIGLQKDINIPNKTLQFKYIKGPYRGTGTWNIEKKTKNITLVNYLIQLEPNNYFFKKVSNTICFKIKHTKDIKDIIKEIEKNSAS